MQHLLYYCKKKPEAFIFKQLYLHIYNLSDRTTQMNVHINVGDQKMSAFCQE